jgi:ketosteroid isomerase-like protein
MGEGESADCVRVRATGRTFDNPRALVFALRGERVAEFRSYEDTAALAEAFRP